MVSTVLKSSYIVVTMFYRGDDFRKAFSEIGSLRSIIPRSVNILALTAIATKETLDVVTERLSLKDQLGLVYHLIERTLNLM